MRLALTSLIVVLFACGGCSDPKKFSATAWQRAPWDKREPMAKDFIANHFRTGMTRAEVVALLGNPDPGFPQELQYKVGSVMIDYRVLWVELDADGKAVSAKIYQTS